MAGAYTLLIIDDEELIRRSLRVFFQDSGIEVLEAANGEEGIDVFRQKQPTVALVDLRMPGMSGLEVIETLSQEAPETPLVVLSGTGAISDAIAAIRKGAWDYVSKPLADLSELEHVIETVLERRKLRQEIRRYQESLEEKVIERTQELMKLNDRLRKIVESTRTIAACSGMREAGRNLLEEFAGNMAAEGGSFYWVENETLVLRHTLDPGHSLDTIPLPAPPASVIGKALTGKKAILVRNIKEETTIAPSGWTGYKDPSLLVFPLVDNLSVPLGVLTLHNKVYPPFVEQDQEIGQILASNACEMIRVTRAMEALQRSEEKYRELVENLNDAVWSHGTDGRITYVSPAIQGILGYGSKELLGRYSTSLFPQTERSRWENCIRKVLCGEASIEEYLMLKTTGDQGWVRASLRPMYEGERVVGVQGILTDISEKKRTEEQLEKKVGELAALNSLGRDASTNLSVNTIAETALNHITRAVHPDLAMIFLRQENRLVLKGCSPEACGQGSQEIPIHRVGECLCGLAASEGNPVFALDVQSDPRCTWEECKKAGMTSFAALPFVSGSETIGILGLASARQRNFSEMRFFLEALTNTITIALRNALLYEKAQADAIELNTRLTQIEDAKKAKEELTHQLQQAQKMEAIGTLAGGIAHDFNNILTPILMGMEMALLNIPVQNQAHPMIEKAHGAALRAKDLVQQILTFSRQSDLDRKPVKVTPILKETLKLARAGLPSTIEIRQDFRAQEDLVFGNPTQIHQVMMNLITNAGHAMRAKGGLLEVCLQESSESFSGSGMAGIHSGRYLQITVRDTGHGMDRRTMDQIFNPFFTTKERGEGTGLGLSIVHGIISSYGGTIKVESQPGVGTTFTIFIPLLEAKAEVKEAEGFKESEGGTERILVVDDESVIVEIYRESLQNFGYRVETRTDAIDAMEAFRKDPGTFDLVITDMTMPKMTGDRLAVELLKIRPNIPIILCTGFSEKIDADVASKIGVRHLLMKPIPLRELVAKVREAIDADRRGK